MCADLFCLSVTSNYETELWSLPHCAILTMVLNHEDTVAWRPAEGKYLLKYYQGSFFSFRPSRTSHTRRIRANTV